MAKKLKVLDLFSGIGGFSLGLERAGMETVAFCEIDPHAREVLKKHWPKVPIWNDVKTLNKDKINAICPEGIDVMCGGFPCQDISVAGKKKGLDGERSGLWTEFKRLIKETRPQYVIIENVANLRSKGLAAIIKDLWQIGYMGEWHLISARSIGAPHLRDRCWIIAYPNGSKLWQQQRGSSRQDRESEALTGEPCKDGQIKTTNSLCNFRLWKAFASQERASRWWAAATSCLNYWRKTQPPICGVDDGLSRELDRIRKERIKQLGNSVVPQIPELIGRSILEFENEKCN